MIDQVVLVDEKNRPLGTAPKSRVHSDQTPLHRGFSVFVFNYQGELLLQRRSHSKKTWGGVWSNSCCGHPRPRERIISAARRRLQEELGLDVDKIKIALPDYRFKAKRNRIIENEICPVLIAWTGQDPRPNPREVAKICWVKWKQFIKSIAVQPQKYSPWCREEAHLLESRELI